MMPLCIRFVDSHLNVREELIEWCSQARITGVLIAAKIKECLKSLGLNIEDCRGQRYDGASNMSSNRVGVQALLARSAQSHLHTLQWSLLQPGDWISLQFVIFSRNLRSHESSCKFLSVYIQCQTTEAFGSSECPRNAQPPQRKQESSR